jgi:hypothetical protein
MPPTNTLPTGTTSFAECLAAMVFLAPNAINPYIDLGAIF